MSRKKYAIKILRKIIVYDGKHIQERLNKKGSDCKSFLIIVSVCKI